MQFNLGHSEDVGAWQVFLRQRGQTDCRRPTLRGQPHKAGCAAPLCDQVVGGGRNCAICMSTHAHLLISINTLTIEHAQLFLSPFPLALGLRM
jgi:hypothetical protein